MILQCTSQGGHLTKPSLNPALSIFPWKIARLLSTIVGCLTIAGVAGRFAYHVLGYQSILIHIFDLDSERSIPTWYSTVTLLLCAVLLSIIALAKRNERDGYTRHWEGLALIFTGLSIDEMVGFHERTIRPIRAAIEADGFLYFSWVVPGAAFVGIFLVAYLRFFVRLPPTTRRLFGIAGLTYAAAALGMELVSGKYLSVYGERDMTYALLTIVEEVGEMMGIVVFIYALLSYISMYIKEGRISVYETESPSMPWHHGST